MAGKTLFVIRGKRIKGVTFIAKEGVCFTRIAMLNCLLTPNTAILRVESEPRFAVTAQLSWRRPRAGLAIRYTGNTG